MRLVLAGDILGQATPIRHPAAGDVLLRFRHLVGVEQHPRSGHFLVSFRNGRLPTRLGCLRDTRSGREDQQNGPYGNRKNFTSLDHCHGLLSLEKEPFCPVAGCPQNEHTHSVCTL